VTNTLTWTPTYVQGCGWGGANVVAAAGNRVQGAATWIF